MPINVTMPALSPTMTEGKLAKWVKKEGDNVESGDVIAEIETDKATMEVEAVDEGKLAKIIVPEGTDGVQVNAVIAVLLDDGETDSDIVIPSDAEGSSPETKAKDPSTTPAIQADSTQDDKKAAPAKVEKGNRIFASPLARRIAADKGIDLSTIQGSGPHGRIIKADVENATPGARPAPKTAAASAPSAGTSASIPSGPDARGLADALGMKYTESENSGMRKVIAKRLLESKQTVPHFYLTIECRIDSLLAARKELNMQANGAYKLSVNDFVVKACANALRAYPKANASWTEEAIIYYDDVDVSVAVATEQGLITPIVKQADNKGLRQISDEIKDLAGRAKEGKLKPEEFQGGGFTVSNLGMFGIQSFSAIINPPQSCILAVGAGEQKPYVDNGEIKIGTFMTCTLSVDHRSVDGAVGAEYLQILKQYIENPMSMLL